MAAESRYIKLLDISDFRGFEDVGIFSLAGLLDFSEVLKELGLEGPEILTATVHIPKKK